RLPVGRFHVGPRHVAHGVLAQVLLWPPGHAIHLEIHDGPHLARRGCALNLCEPIFRTAEHHLQHLWRVGELLEGCQPKSDLLVRLRNLKGPHHAKPGRGPTPNTTEWGLGLLSFRSPEATGPRAGMSSTGWRTPLSPTCRPSTLDP